MKKIQLAALIVLLLALAFAHIPKVSSTSQERPFTPALPDVPQEPMPEGYTTEDYLNTTNPYSQLGGESDEEGDYPLYVLVFGDEEERLVERDIAGLPVNWQVWAELS